MKIRSALVRPLDPRYPTNLAVMILAPLAGIVTGGLALWLEHPPLGVLETAVRGSLTAFAGWALAREVAPDDNPVAFLCLSLALLTCLLLPSASVMLVLTAIMLVRVVNRSVGVPATAVDSLAATLLTAWAAWSTRHAGPALVASVAFGLDATLPSPLRRQWIFAFACLAGGLSYQVFADSLTAGETGLAFNLPVITIALLYAWSVLRLRRVHSVADLTGEQLNPSRVRAGMAIAWLMALQGPLSGELTLVQSAMMWAILAGLSLMVLIRPILPTGAGEAG